MTTMQTAHNVTPLPQRRRVVTHAAVYYYTPRGRDAGWRVVNLYSGAAQWVDQTMPGSRGALFVNATGLEAETLRVVAEQQISGHEYTRLRRDTLTVGGMK